MKGRPIIYSAEEMAWLEANRLLPIGEYQFGFADAFDRGDVMPGHLHSLRKRMGWKTGRTGHFSKGGTPANKGKPMPYHPNSAATRFKKGERRGVAVRLYKPIGTERVMDGYLQRKVNDDLPLQRRWRAVHLINWEAANGPIPEGHALKCLDGNRMNVAADNWKAIPRAVLARLNGGRHRKTLAYDDASPELKPTVMMLAEARHAAMKARERA